MMVTLLIATNNPGKLVEMRSLLADLPCRLVSLKEAGVDFFVDEDGRTYQENANKKAVAYSLASGLLTLADDTGLEVEALGGLPGLHSARITGQPGANDADRRRHLLEQLASFSRPWRACFTCTLAIVQPGSEAHFFVGECPGEIIPEERGTHGFGYDPIFWIAALQKSMAELEPFEKNQVSHRARAVQAARSCLTDLINCSA